MNITAIYGTGRKDKSSTYNMAQKFIDILLEGDKSNEFFLPKDMPNFCRGCWLCFDDYKKCPDYNYLEPIVDAMVASDLIIFTAPVYVYHVPGQVKAFLDHFGYQWMPHQPRKEMFTKQALIISAAAGAGTKSAIKDIKDSMNYWGVGRTYTFGKNTHSADWHGIDDNKRTRYDTDITKLAMKIKSESKNIKPSLRVKGNFYLMRHLNKKKGFGEVDLAHWKKHGWLEKDRPWK